VDVGDYHISAQQPASNSTLRIDFHLYATVREEDEAEFAALFARLEHRFRDQIIFEVRKAELTDLTDPGLGLIKRRILEKSNRLFGRPILQTVVVSEFSFVEQ
jgi:flagellar FliL protein